MTSFLQVLTTYGVIIVEFIVEFYVFLALFLHKLGKRNHFWLRVSLFTVAYFALGLPLAWFYTAFGETVWGRILVYLILFGTATLFVFRSFDVSYETALFACGIAYAAQNLVYKLFLIFWTAGETVNLYENWGGYFNLYYRIIYYLFLAASYTVVWFLFVKNIGLKLKTHEIDRKMLFVTVFVLATTVILCSVEDIYFAKLSVWRENRFDNPVYYFLRETGNIFSVECCAITLILASKTIVERSLQREVKYLKHALRQGERQYEISKDTIDAINVKCHDIKYKLAALAAKNGVASEAWEDLRKSVSIYDTRIETGNKLLDVLLTEKSLYCEQNKIAISCMADGKKLDFMEDIDIYCMFGNLLDNALDAVKKIEPNERRIVDLSVREKDGIILVQEENYFDGVLEFVDGLPVSTKKEDKNYHGFGMHSLCMIVRKYGGVLTASALDDIFRLNIMIPVPSLPATDGENALKTQNE